MAKQPAAGPSNGQGVKNMRSKPKPPAAPTAQMPVMPSRDLFHRVNFSYQAAIFLQSLNNSGSIGESSSHAQRPQSSSADQPRKGRTKGKGKARMIEGIDGDEAEEQAMNGRSRSVDYGRLARTGMRECKKMGVHTQLKL